MMDNLLYMVSYVASAFFELYIISKYMKLFLGKRNINKQKITLVYLAKLIVGILQYAWLPYEIINVAVTIGMLFLITMCYGKRMVNRAIATAFTFMCMFASEAVVAMLIGLSGVDLTDSRHEGDAFVFISVQLISWLICEVISIFKNINDEIVMPKLFGVSMIVLTILIFTMELNIFMQKNLGGRIKMLSVFCMFMVLFLMIYLYDTISGIFKEKLQTDRMEMEKNYYYQQAQLLQKSSTELRKFRHDISNHLYVLEGMIGEENIETQNYLQNLTRRVQQTQTFSSTGNVAFDSIINYKLSDAHERGIKVCSHILLPGEIAVKSDDIVTIMGNLLDNAIEAADSLEDDKYIDLKIKSQAGAVWITVRNSYNGVVFQREGELLTKKEDTLLHGIGLKNVNAAVEQYNGEMELTYDAREFCVKIMLYMEE